MKHLSWVLFTVFCSAVLQVQPAAPIAATSCCGHCHCQVPGDCGMPCSPCTATDPLVFAQQGQASVATPAAAKAAKPAAVKIYASCTDEPASKAKPTRTAKAMRAAVEPLFMVQCRILI
ncbi:MAG TPA: hypothetical protein VIJ19_10760 [Opitutaceae bacterium]